MELQYPPDAVLALTQHRHKQYYDGSEIVVAGRIADNKLSTFKADVRAHGVNGEQWGRCRNWTVPRYSKLLFPLLTIPSSVFLSGEDIYAQAQGLDRLEWSQSGANGLSFFGSEESFKTPHIICSQA